MALTPQRQRFLNFYIANGMKNGAEAAVLAGYSPKNARQQAAFLLTIPDIQVEIQRRLDEQKVDADEALNAMSEMARSTMEDFLTIDDKGVWRIDLKKAEDAGKLHLIKKIRETKYGISIELYDKQQAIAYLGKHHGLWKDGIQISVNVELVVKVVQAAEEAGLSASELFNDLLAEIASVKAEQGGSTAGSQAAVTAIR